MRHDRRAEVLLLGGPVSRAVLAQAAADATLRAVVLTDVTGVDPAALPDLCLQIETFPKPVVVALDGATRGLDLALAAHFRVARATATLCLPEVTLGLLPCAGATQRLPRLIGAEQALRLLLGGASIGAAEALALGLLDHVVEDKLTEAALAAALRLADSDWQQLRAGQRREGLRDPLVYQDSIRRARAGLGGPLPAPARIVDCVEAAGLLPYDQGLGFEAAAYADLAATPASRALRYMAQADLRAGLLPTDLQQVPLPDLAHVAIWGVSAQTVEVARAGLAAGLRITLMDPHRDALVQAVEKIAALQELALAEGRISADARDADWARLSPALAASAAEGADLLLRAPEAWPWPQGTPSPPVVILGGVAEVALSPPTLPEGIAEMAVRPGAPLALQALALAVARRLGWRVLRTGAGGPIERRLRASLSAVVVHLEAQGLARGAIAGALAGFGLGVPYRPNPPTAEARHVVPLCLAALANAGAKLLADGVALRPCDIDAVAVGAGLLPRWQGGPMFQADRRGLIVLRADLRAHKDAAPQIFTPAPLLEDLIADGRDFAALDG